MIWVGKATVSVPVCSRESGWREFSNGWIHSPWEWQVLVSLTRQAVTGKFVLEEMLALEAKYGILNERRIRCGGVYKGEMN